MLSGNERTDGTVEVTAEDTSPTPSNDPDQSDEKGSFCDTWLSLNHCSSLPPICVHVYIFQM